MYAAAGGASLASRQARKKQAQQNTKNKATNQQILREKLAAKAATTPTKSKHFHQLPASYLRAPHQHHRKLSAGYTSIPGAEQQPPAAAPPMHHRFADHPCASYTGPAAVTPSAAHHAHGVPGHLGHAHHHHHHHHHAVGVPGHPCHLHGAAGGPSGHPPASGASFPPMPKPTGFREYDRLVRRQQLTKSATATLPLVSQAQETPPQTPEQTLGGFGEPAHPHHHPQQLLLLEHQHQHHHHSQQHLDKLGHDDQEEEEQEHEEEEGEEEAGDADALTQPLTLQIPNDPIIITPATPQATPPGRLGLKPLVLTDDEEVRPLASPAPGALERKCSVYRARKYDDPFEERHYNATTISSAQHHQYQPDDVFFPPAGGSMPNGGGHSTTTTTPGHQQGQLAKWDSEYYCCECDHRQYGVCTCDQFECAQGRAAWLERGRRCSVQETPASCHRRWVKRNRIQDSSLGGSSDDEDLLGVLRGPSSFANAFLYVGLGTIAIGLVIAFVGTGEKGFKTVELRLIGPSLIGLGLLCCTLRILFCICPSHCISSSRRARDKKNAKIDADHRTSLLRGDSKRVSIARGPHIPTKQPQIYPKSIVKTKTYEGVEALRQIATTSLFLQNEQKVSSNRIVPIIKEPEKLEEPPLELKKLESRKDEAAIVSISDGEDDSHRKSDTQVIDLTGEDQDDEQSHSPSSGTSHQRKDSKLRRQRTSVHQQKPARELQSSAYGGAAGHNTAPSEPSSLLMETSLMIIGPTPLSSPTKAANATPPTRTPGGTLTVPTLSANGSAVHGAGQPGSKTATSSTTPGNLLTLPAAAAAATASSTAGSAGGPTVSFAGSTLLPGQLSPLPSTSYLPSSSVAGGYRSSSTSSPLPGFMPSSVSPHYHSNSSSSSSNYIYSPPPFTQHAEPTAHGTNTITTAASTTLLHAPSVSSNKTEPELVLSPAKLGQ